MNTKHYKILIQGPEVWNEWRKSHPGVNPDLSWVDLGKINLAGVDLSGANLKGATFAPGWKITKK